MLAFDRIYKEPSSQFSMDPMDPTMHDPFSAGNVDQVYTFMPYPTFPQTVHSVLDGYYPDGPYHSYPHPPSVSPSISTTQSSEQPSLRSSMSCASPASPSPSTIGSPYPREIVPGIGSVTSDDFSHSYDMGPDPFPREKLHNSFVGECVNISSNFNSQVSPSSVSKSQSWWRPDHAVARHRSPVPPLSSPSNKSPMVGGRACVGNVNRNGRAFSSPTPSSPTAGFAVASNRKRSYTEANKNEGVLKPRKSPVIPSNMKRSSTPSPPSHVSTSSHCGSFQKSFFSQSSGNYVPPLESSCWFFPCLYPSQSFDLFLFFFMIPKTL
jgi:hypothetical protein